MDKLSLNSLSSDNVSSEFEVIASNSSNSMEMGLKIAGNGDENQLKKQLAEVMACNDSSNNGSTDSANVNEAEVQTEERPNTLEISPQKQVDDPDRTPTKATMPVEKSYKDEDCILFNGVYYLGCASVNAPRSEAEALKTISILRAQHEFLPPHDLCRKRDLPTAISQPSEEKHQYRIEVVLSVPSRADGTVRLLEPSDSGVIASFRLYTILFCVRGADDSVERDCFAFTESHQSSGIFQCHVFRCDVPEAVRKVLYSFELAFRSIPKSPDALQPTPSAGLQLLKRPQAQGIADLGVMSSQSSVTSDGVIDGAEDVDESIYGFTVTLEIKEDDGKGAFSTVPWDKTSSCFKFRQNLEKQVVVTVAQTSNIELTIERCFGLLLSPGRNVKQSDMHLLDMERATLEEDIAAGATHSVRGIWDPSNQQFALLNTETQKGTRVFLSVAVDLVVQEVQEPVRFLIETNARIFPQNEKFWYFGRKVLHENFFIRLKEIENRKLSKKMFEVESIESETSRARKQVHAAHVVLSSSSPQDEENDDDTDEPLLSGSGEVNKECSERVLLDWGDALSRWRTDLSRLPAGVRSLVRSGAGIPDPLRGEVWQLLAGCHANGEMLEKYRIYITMDSPQENIIQRDIHRTFPAHDYFKDAGGLGQDSLYRISKAYSVFDLEVGYCQGLSFLAAALLLHMPEEQAFCVLVKIMYQYKMRDLFKNGFEDLHLKFYQLQRCIEDLMPNLSDHFEQLSIECHMFSSQWFLTLFTAKFPLNMVFQVVDIFLCEGELVVFQVALALLECCRRELLTLDFEGVLKYFRVQLPKKYRSDDQVKLLIRTAVSVKVTHKKLARYKKDYLAVKDKMALNEDPLVRIERENKQLMESSMRLELENDDIAQELITTRLTLSTQLDRTMEHADDLQQDLQAAVEELRTTRTKASELADENNRLIVETKQVKEMCRREMARQEEDITAKSKIIADYKTICSQLSLRVENLQTQHKEELEAVRNEVQSTKLNSPEEFVAEAQRKALEEKERLQKQTRALELELAQTKLKLVESECKVQDVEHRLAALTKEVQASKNTWFQKTFSNLTQRKADSTPNVPSPSGATAPHGVSFNNVKTSPVIETGISSFSAHQTVP